MVAEAEGPTFGTGKIIKMVVLQRRTLAKTNLGLRKPMRSGIKLLLKLMGRLLKMEIRALKISKVTIKVTLLRVLLSPNKTLRNLLRIG